MLCRGQRPVDLSDEERRQLTALAGRTSCARRLVRRARIILLAADGLSNEEIARAVGANHQTVAVWRRRFAAGRMDSLRDRSSRRPAPHPNLPAPRPIPHPLRAPDLQGTRDR